MTVFVWTAGEIAFSPVASAYVGDVAPDALRGRYYGAYTLTHSLGVVLGPGLGTALYSLSPGALWAACAALGLAGALLVLISPRPPTHRPRAG
jgi:MFS family permease